MRWVKDFLAQSQGWEDFSRELESQWVGDVMRMSEHEIRNWRRNCEVIRRVKDLGWSMQEDILALIRLKVTRIATTETVQWAAFGLFEVVCEARDAVAIKESVISRHTKAKNFILIVSTLIKLGILRVVFLLFIFQEELI